MRMDSTLRMLGLAALMAAAGVAQAVPPVGPSDLGTVAVPFTAAFGDTFGDLSSVTAVSPPGVWSSLAFNFTDAYTFNYGPTSKFDSFVATIDLGGVLGIANFQAALFSGTALVAGTYLGSYGTASGAIAGLGWTGTGPVVTLSDPSLPGGAYTLEIRGLVTGTSGGSYAGVMNISPVPEASNLTLMLAGLGVVAFMARRRRRAT